MAQPLTNCITQVQFAKYMSILLIPYTIMLTCAIELITLYSLYSISRIIVYSMFVLIYYKVYPLSYDAYCEFPFNNRIAVLVIATAIELIAKYLSNEIVTNASIKYAIAIIEIFHLLSILLVILTEIDIKKKMGRRMVLY